MIRIRDSENFQHYKNRSPPWIKLHRDMIEESEQWYLLSGEAAKLLIELRVLASKTEEGTINRNIPSLAWKLRRNSTEETRTLLQELVRQDFIEFEDPGDDDQLSLGGQVADTMPTTRVQGDTPEGEGEGEGEKKKNRSNAHPPAFGFEDFWDAYPIKRGRKLALDKWKATRRKGVAPETIMAGLKRYLAYKEKVGERVHNPATFLGPQELRNDGWDLTEEEMVRLGLRTAQDQDVSDVQKRFAGKVPDVRPRPNPPTEGPQKVGDLLGSVIPNQGGADAER